MTEELQNKLIDAILDANRDIANKIVDGWACQYGYEKAIVEILEPALDKIGKMWAEVDTISLAQGYMAGKIAEDIFSKAIKIDEDFSGGSGRKGTIVIGNIEDDYHSLGRNMIAASLRISGWQVYDLGNDVLAEDFVDKACEIGASVIGVSAMMYTTAMNIKKLRDEIDRRGLTEKIKLVVGGAIFILRPELVEEVGGDGTARNAFAVSELMEELFVEREQDE